MFGPALIAVTILAFVLLGYELALRWRRDRAGALELALAAATIASLLWIATVWLAALAHRLDRPTMLARTAAVMIAAIALMAVRVRRKELTTGELARETLLTWGVAAIPIALWIAFILWRSAIVPPLSHDALAYHLPRAVLWIRQHAFGPITVAVDARMRILPPNYELLLADVILLGNGDAYTEWISVFFYVAFLIACGALAERWWSGATKAALPVVVLAAATPVLLLHTGADKNDIMMGFFMVAALVWTGRWFSQHDIRALALCGLTIAAAIGTKPQGLMLAACLLPIVVWRAVRDLRAKQLRAAALVRVIVFCAVASLLLGGAFYAAKLAGDRSVDVSSDPHRSRFVAYDDWRNLWQAPWVLLTAPFSPNPDELYVPWSDRMSSHTWFWKRDEIYFSHLGIPFVVCVLLLPFAIARFRRQSPEVAAERAAIAIAALATLVIMFPVRDVPMPHGIYTAALPRYALFIVPVVFSLTLAPAFLRFAKSGSRFAHIALYVFVAWFMSEASHAAVNDRFVPVEYLSFAVAHRGTRIVPFNPYRAACVLDALAGPDDKVAFDAGYAAWIHPAFGRELRRPVTFIVPGPGAPAIPRDAKWVVVDRSFAIIWQHPDFHDTADARRYLSRGTAPESDTRVVRALLADPRFERVYYDARMNQAVFRVRAAAR
jgi:hypothetical protein